MPCLSPVFLYLLSDYAKIIAHTPLLFFLPSLFLPHYLPSPGGQTEEQATQNLNLINQLAKRAPSSFRPSLTTCPWILSFSFGRSLQASVLAAWKGKEENYTAAVTVAGALARANAQAQLGEYVGPHPSLLEGKSLHETNRGFYGQGVAGVAGTAASGEEEKAAEVPTEAAAEKQGEGEKAKAKVQAAAAAADVTEVSSSSM